MTVRCSNYAARGRISIRDIRDESDHSQAPSLLAVRRSLPTHITTSEIHHQRGPISVSKPPGRLAKRLATVREDTFRRLRSIIATSSAPPKDDNTTSASRGCRANSQQEQAKKEAMPGSDFLRAGTRNGASARSSVTNLSGTIPSPARSRQNSVLDQVPQVSEEKPVAVGHGVSLGVNLAEPVLFLQGFEPGDVAQRNTAMLRGTLHLKVAKTAKLKAVTLRFRGSACTKWPEGVLCTRTISMY